MLSRNKYGKSHMTQQTPRGVSQAAKRAEVQMRNRQNGAFLQHHMDLKAAAMAKARDDAYQV